MNFPIFSFLSTLLRLNNLRRREVIFKFRAESKGTRMQIKRNMKAGEEGKEEDVLFHFVWFLEVGRQTKTIYLFLFFVFKCMKHYLIRRGLEPV